MIVRALFVRALHERWVAMAIATGVLVLWLPLAMAIYRDIDTSLYTNLPEAIRELMGIPAGADAAALAYNVMLTFAAAVTISGVAISVGANAIAGDEERGTLGLTLAAGVRRDHIVATRAAAMAILVAGACVTIWLVAEATPRLLGVDIGNTHLAAMSIHLGAAAVFHGALALAVGAATGDRSRAASTATAVLVVSYVATGVLPLIDALSPAVRVFPWYHLAAGDPLANGLQWSHLAILVAGSTALSVWAVAAFRTRDIGGHTRRRLLALTARRAPDRAGDDAGQRRSLTALWTKTLVDHRGLLAIVALSMFGVMGVLMGPMYTAIEDDIIRTAGDLPEAVMALAGNGDLTTPEGWFQTETFSLMAPIAVMIVAVVLATKGLAGEEAAGRMSLVLAHGATRRRVVAELFAAVVVAAMAIGVATASGVSIANEISGLEMSHVAIAATSGLAVLLGLVFGALALTIAAATGSVRAATYGVSIAALTSHLFNAFLPLTEDFSGLAELTPHHYFLGSDPLVNAMNWTHGALLAGLAVGFAATAVMLFERRDLRAP